MRWGGGEGGWVGGGKGDYNSNSLLSSWHDFQGEYSFGGNSHHFLVIPIHGRHLCLQQ